MSQDISFFLEVLEKVKGEYVGEINNKKSVENALDGMLSSLDPYSAFLDEEEFKEFQSISSGEFIGIGIEVRMENGFLKVISCYDGSPGQRAGVIPGDYIISINGANVRGMKLKDAVKKLKERDTSEISILRGNNNDVLNIKVRKARIPTAKISASVISDGVLYIKVPSFYKSVSSSLKKEIKSLVASNPNFRGMILDFRSNSGGLFDEACDVADLFLDSGEIVATKGRKQKDLSVYMASPGDLIDGKPLVVLINQGTASAPEIVAGALKDNKRAIIVGEKSFGKGSVQSVFPMRGGTAIKLTTYLYYTPSRAPLQDIGIEPDILVENMQVVTAGRVLPSELRVKNTLFPNKPKEADRQLTRAIDVINAMHIVLQRTSGFPKFP